MADPLDRLPAFEAAVRTRLDAGRVAYGDKSFSADPKALVDELQQEALDLAGWGYVLWCRLESMRVAIRFAEIQSDAPADRWTHARPGSEQPGRLVGAERNG